MLLGKHYLRTPQNPTQNISVEFRSMNKDIYLCIMYIDVKMLTSVKQFSINKKKQLNIIT